MKDSQSANLRNNQEVKPKNKKPKKFKKTGLVFQPTKPQQPLEKKVTLTSILPQKQKKQFVSFHTMFARYEGDIQLLFIPLILLIVLYTLSYINNTLEKQIASKELLPTEQPVTMQPYPFVTNIITPAISAKAAIITDAESQVILFSKNPHLRFSMASTTKIMTALVALDHYNLDDILTVQSAGIEGAGLQLRIGEQFYFRDLLYAMLLPSANDAAVTIADNYPGGSEAFVAKMNEKAKSLHLNNTHYMDPTGLGDDEDYTTVVDLARLASYATKNSTFTQVTGTKERAITNIDQGKQYALSNLNKLLGIDGVTGMKTGTTEGAGEVLVTSILANDHTYIIIVMNSQDRFLDTRMLITFIKENVQYMNPSGFAK